MSPIILDILHSLIEYSFKLQVSNSYLIDKCVCTTFISAVNLPVITKNPMNTSLSLKSNFTSVSLTCEADRASSYYWRRQDGSIPSSATGVNTNNLTIINLQLKDAGYYQCVATNGSGSTESEYAKLTLTGI